MRQSLQPPQRHAKSGLFRWRWLVLLVLLLPLLSYMVSLDMRVRSQFEGKRWALPAQVYARPLDLYPGLKFDLDGVVAELDDLGYRAVEQVKQPGEYRRKGEELLISTRGFTFWDSAEPARKIRLRFDGDSLAQSGDLETGQALPMARLEPLPIGKIYPTHNEDRVLVSLDEVPADLVNALTAMEDRAFFEHGGVSFRGIFRAMYQNLKAGEWVQGGSTLTQQLVKNYYLSSERTLSRKLNEALMAVLLELHYTKEEILEAYLNEVYMGQDGDHGIHGIGMASWFYFNRPINELKLAESALLVGLVRAASLYNPRKHPERARQRRELVLDKMAELGMISTIQAADAKSEPLALSEETSYGTASRYPAFLDLVRRQLQEDYKEEDLRSEGLKIFTTLDPLIQRQAERSLARQAGLLEKENRIRKLEGAIVVAGTDDGEILAVVGGRDSRYQGFNRALGAVRPIGSLVKPAVYLTALEKSRSFSLISPLKDTAFEWKDKHTGKLWIPSNYDKRMHGSVPLYRALANSYNLATVHLGIEVGLENVKQTLQRLGVKSSFEAYPSMLLGGISLAPVEVAQMYHTLANGGFHSPLRAIRNILTHDNRPLNRYSLSVEPRFDPAPVFVLNYALREVTRSGTANRLAKEMPNVALAGKTGTTNDYRDSWFAGFGGDLLAVAWLGRDDNKPIRLSGSEGALRVWSDLMRKLQPGSLHATPPSQIEWRWVQAGGQRVKMPFIVNGARLGAFNVAQTAGGGEFE